MSAPKTVQISSRLRALLLRAERSLARLDGALATVPDPRPFVAMCLRREAASSSGLAGAPVSIEDLLAVEAGLTVTGGAARGVAEARNQIAALEQGLAELSGSGVSGQLLGSMHARLLGEGRSGPTAGRALREIERYLTARDDLPDLLRIGLIHSRLLAVRPFPSGTGRIGRLVIPLLLVERGVLRSPVLHLSGQLRLHRRRYHTSLNAARDQGDQEGWLTFFLEQLDEASVAAAEDARRVLLLQAEQRGVVIRELGRTIASGLQVLEALPEAPIVSVHDVQERIGTTYAAANNLVARLVALGILVEFTGNARNRRFRYDPFMQLFSESGGR